MYATATVSSASVVLTDLKAFCIANGWTANTDQVEGAGRRITVSKIANSFMHFRSVVNESSSIPTNAYPYGIGMMGSRTNNTTSFASNTEYSYNAVMAAINPSVPVTYHFFSTADGNNIAVVVTSFMVGNPAIEYNLYLGFGTSILKTTTVNDTWYWYGVNCSSSALDYPSSYSILTSGVSGGIYNSFLTCSGAPGGNGCYGQFGFYSTSTFYNTSSTPQFYMQTYNAGNNGIFPLAGASSNGIGAYEYLIKNSASSAYANTVLVPSFVFMKHPTVGANLIGTVPMVWGHNSVPLLYKSGSHITIAGKEYVVFRNQAYEVTL